MLYVDEIFLSIQGESTDTGLPTIFIRLYGCPIKCSYCDQPQTPADRHRASLANIMEQVKKYKGFDRVCITGGEPLIQEDTMALVYELQYEGYNVSIETSGCFPIEVAGYKRSYRYIMDIKCPSSGVVHKNIYDNLLRLTPEDEVVFVIADRKDYDFMKHTLQKYPTLAKVLLSPMFNPEGHAVIGHELVEWLLADKLNKVRVQIQLHKCLGVQ